MKTSIITATYNSALTITDCINSVNNQSYKNIEHIIIDGASKDDTVNKIKSQPGRVSILLSEPDQGMYNAMNKGIHLSTGKIIAILNSDDIFFDNTVIEKVVTVFNETNADCVFGDLVYVDKTDSKKIVRSWKTNNYSSGGFNKGWHPAHPSFFLKKEIYERYGAFNLSFKLAADFELMLRMLEKNRISSVYLPIPLVKMRLGGISNKNILNILYQNLECYKAFKTNNLKVDLTYPFYRLIPKLKQYSLYAR